MMINTSVSVVSVPVGLQRRSAVQNRNTSQPDSKQAESNRVDLQSAVESQNAKAASNRIQNVEVAEKFTSLAKYQLQANSEVAASSQANVLAERVLKLLGE